MGNLQNTLAYNDNNERMFVVQDGQIKLISPEL